MWQAIKQQFSMPDINGDLLIQKAEGLQVNTLTLAKLYHSIYIDRI